MTIKPNEHEANKAQHTYNMHSLKPVYKIAARAAVQALARVQVCAGLFCWTGVMGVVGSCKGLLSECLSRHRSDTVAAAYALGLKVRRSAVQAFGLATHLHGIIPYEADCSNDTLKG